MKNMNYKFSLRENKLTGKKDELYLRDIFIGYYKLGDHLEIEDILNYEVYPGVGLPKDYEKVYPTYKIIKDTLYVEDTNIPVLEIKNRNFNTEILNILRYKPNFDSRFNYFTIEIKGYCVNELNKSYGLTVKRLATLRSISKKTLDYKIKPLFII
jgi:hypothetical protein